MHGIRLLPVALLACALGLPGSGRADVSFSSTRAGDDRATLSGLAAEGYNLSATSAAELEARIAAAPDDYANRAVLLGYYMTARFRDPEAKAARIAHILWIIEHRPESAVGPELYLLPPIDGAESYALAKTRWLAHVQARPDDVVILGNAASFLMLQERDLALGYLERARKLEPRSPEWPERIGRAHLGTARLAEAGDKRYAEASVALKALEQAVAMIPELDRKLLLYADLADAAYLVKRDDKATDYAQALVGKTAVTCWCYANAVHDGNTVLGLVALREKKPREAVACLIQSGDVKGSPQLDSFGPRMELAKALLEAGERDAVLDYLDEVGRFWKMGGKHLGDWVALIKAGRTPEFKNLRLRPQP
jgi:hypothetical protein